MDLRREDYISRVRATSKEYFIKWQLQTFMHNTSQIVVVAGAAVVPFLLNISGVPTLIPTIISGIVAILAAIGSYFKFGERRGIYRRAFEALKKEIDYFDLGGGPYKGLDAEEAFQRFLELTEALRNEYIQSFFSFAESQQLKTVESSKH